MSAPSSPQRPPHYLTGRSALWCFLAVFGQGIALHLWEIPGLSDEPAFMRNYVEILKVFAPLVGAPGVVAAVGIMRGKEWAPKLMAGLLWLSAAFVVLCWVGAVYAAFTGAPVAKGRSPVVFAAGSLVVTVFMAGFLVAVAQTVVEPEEEAGEA